MGKKTTEKTFKVYVGRRALGDGILEMKMDGWRLFGRPTYPLLLPFVYQVGFIRDIHEPVKDKPPLTLEEQQGKTPRT